MNKLWNPLDAPPKKYKQSSYKTYDERTYPFVDQGCSYGTGHKNPVGSQGNPLQRVPSLPYGRVDINEKREQE